MKALKALKFVILLVTSSENANKNQEKISRLEPISLPVLSNDKKRKLTSFFIFTLLCGASKGFVKT